MADESDWRLTTQENFLKGVTLVHRSYCRYPPDTTSDHDHCELCWAKFMVEDYPDVLHQGCATTDDYHWICEKCFDDFKDLFGWTVIDDIA